MHECIKLSIHNESSSFESHDPRNHAALYAINPTMIRKLYVN